MRLPQQIATPSFSAGTAIAQGVSLPMDSQIEVALIVHRLDE